MSWLDEVKWNEQGLAPVVTLEAGTGALLMQAWANREALQAAVAEGRAIYWSRSRGCLWRKGEQSGHVQKLVEVYLDCDGDSICYRVEQRGGIACHTGRRSCFFRKLDNEAWHLVEPNGAGNRKEEDA